MTRAQLELAAKIYSLAVIAHDGLESDQEDELFKVKRLASKRAANALRRLMIDPSEVILAEDCIEKAKELS